MFKSLIHAANDLPWCSGEERKSLEAKNGLWGTNIGRSKARKSSPNKATEGRRSLFLLELAWISTMDLHPGVQTCN